MSDKSQQPLIFVYYGNIGNMIAVDLFKQGHNVLVGGGRCLCRLHHRIHRLAFIRRRMDRTGADDPQ